MKKSAGRREGEEEKVEMEEVVEEREEDGGTKRRREEWRVEWIPLYRPTRRGRLNQGEKCETCQDEREDGNGGRWNREA